MELALHPEVLYRRRKKTVHLPDYCANFSDRVTFTATGLFWVKSVAIVKVA